ncbi:MAG: prolipoprotein diacylglyceryl transferase [Clostridia bacterium]|nr:prolipoprotein diacylglyceryl transferase [Clostridia bacterium]
MKKYGLCLLTGIMALATCFAVLCLCIHGSMLPEKVTAYYEAKAQTKAEAATGAEAELMALLLGSAPIAAPAEETVPNTPDLSFRGSALSRPLAACTLVLYLLALLFFARKPEENKGALWALILSGPLALAGARLVYCLTDISFYLNDIQSPQAMLKIWEGGLSQMGCMLFLALAGALGAKIAGEKPLTVLNKLSPFMLVWAALMPLANTFIQGGYGPEMSLPLLTLTIHQRERLSTALITFLVLIVLGGLLKSRKLPKDKLFLYTAFLYGCLMVPLESLRRDGHMVWGFVHAEMLYAMVIALPAGLALVQKNRRLALLAASALLAVAVIALEFALDRSNIKDELLYIVYLLCIAGYIFAGLKWAKGLQTETK